MISGNGNTAKKRTVFVSGNFNVLHPGHVRLLQFAKKSGDWLIVGVMSDHLAGDAAHVPEALRLAGISCNNLVDEAILIDSSLEKTILSLKPDIVVKGREYEYAINPEHTYISSYGGRLLFSSGETIFSSLDLIKKEYKESTQNNIDYPEEYLIRHNISKSNLIKLVKNFQNLKICVVGDLIVDEYITCQPLGMSQEDPTIVVSPINSARFIGGAGIVAAHAAGLGAKVVFTSVVGSDNVGKYCLAELKKLGVEPHLFVDESRPTTLKQRYRASGKSLLRVSHLHQSNISIEIQKKIEKVLDKKLINSNALIFSDFNYGCLPQPLVDTTIKKAKKYNVFTAGDSQSSSQVGDIARFKDLDLITPTEHEARISTRDQESGLIILADKLRQQASAKNILLKMGEEGMIIHAETNSNDRWITDKIDALNRMPKDVAGAGDSLLTVATLSMACGGSIWEATYLGSLAAAIQIGRVGNTPLTVNQLIEAMKA